MTLATLIGRINLDAADRRNAAHLAELRGRASEAVRLRREAEDLEMQMAVIRAAEMEDAR